MMSKNNLNQRSEQGFVMVPYERLEAIEKMLSEILALSQSKKGIGSESLNHITEKEAMNLVGKKGTWFWLMRRSGQLKFTKVGSKVFYSVDELQKLVSEGGRV